MKRKNIMVPFFILAGLALLSASSTSFAEESAYWFKRGELWSGVKIGDSAPRTRDTICRDSRCYIINEIHWPVSQAMRLHGVSRFTFKELQPTALEQTDYDQLLLPNDLGKLIYQRAAREAYLDRHDRNEKWPHSRPFH